MFSEREQRWYEAGAELGQRMRDRVFAVIGFLEAVRGEELEVSGNNVDPEKAAAFIDAAWLEGRRAGILEVKANLLRELVGEGAMGKIYGLRFTDEGARGAQVARREVVDLLRDVLS